MDNLPEEPKRPRFTVRLQECPVCKHAWARHNEEGACQVKDCWCVYNPPEEDVEVE